MSSEQNRVYLFRLQTLIIEGGTLVVRNVFDQKIPCPTLSALLKQEKKTIDKLKKTGKITDVHYHLLFPTGSDPKSETFDLTLLICLLRNICGLNNQYKWKTPIDVNDLTLEADLHRIKEYRNNISHLSNTTCITESDFLKRWSDIEQVLIRLNSSVPNSIADLQKTIDRYKTDPLDPNAEAKFIQDAEAEIERVYKKRRLDLKEDLIAHTDELHSTLQFSPFEEEHDTSLLDMYVMPELNSVDIQSSVTGMNEPKTPIGSLQGIFREQSRNCKEIYITAEAGVGKTALCKRIAVTWCQAHQPDESKSTFFSDDDICAMKEFDFLFIILLRESNSDCEIDYMILNQIIETLSRSSKYSIDFLQEILHREPCLIVLDGLDEWFHPDSTCRNQQKCIPHRKARNNNCTFITTSRPWKLSVITLKKRQIDRKVELVGFSKESASKEFKLKELKERAISTVKNVAKHQVEHEIKSFDEQIKENAFEDMETNPLMLTCLVCLWADGMPFGQTKCELYSNITELFLSRAERMKNIQSFRFPRETGGETNATNYPKCIRTLRFCKKYYRLLLDVGRLAFQTLFKDVRENRLSFDSSVAEEFLEQDHLEFCFRSGILTKSKLKSYTSKKSRVSFPHKTLQEFFAALYLSTSCDQSNLMNSIESICDSVPNILEMSKVFLFLSGIDSQIICIISDKLKDVIAKDSKTIQYRKTATHWIQALTVKQLKDIQDMNVAFVKEILHMPMKTVNICLQDFAIGSDCQNDKYLSVLKVLAISNKDEMKSLSIEMKGTFNQSIHEIIDSFELKDVHGLNKVYLRGKLTEGDVKCLLSGSASTLESIALINEWQEHDIEKYSYCFSTMFSILNDMCRLSAINIEGLSIPHEDLIDLFSYLKTRHVFKQIILSRIICKDHNKDCLGEELDLTKNKTLKLIRLRKIPLSHLKFNALKLIQCDVGQFENGTIVPSFLDQLTLAKNLKRLHCDGFESPDHLKKMLETLNILHSVESIVLRNLHVGDSSILLPNHATKIHYFQLFNVTMSSSGFKELVEILTGFQHSVKICIKDCHMTPEEEYRALKEELIKSSAINVMFDGLNPQQNNEFTFKMIKDSTSE